MGDHSDIDHTGITGTGGSVATDAIFDAKGDLAVGTGANTAAKLTVGANDTSPIADSAQSTGLKWGYPVHTAAMNQLAADVTMTNANTYYDGPSLSCTAGTYVFFASMYWSGEGNGGQGTAKLWNGTTVISSAVGYAPGGTGRVSIPLVGYRVLSGTETIKVSMASDGGLTKMLKAANANGAGDNACTLVALRIA